MAERRVPRWAFWVGTPLVLIGLLIAFWSWDWFIPLAERRASAALGRPVKIEHLHVRLGRVTEIAAEDLRIGNPDGFADNPPFARAERLAVAVDLGAYWHDRSIVIPSIDLTRPVVEAVALEDGRRNYAFDFGGPAGEPAQPGQAPPAPRIGLLRITEGRAHFVDPRLKADFNMDVATRGEDTPDPRRPLVRAPPAAPTTSQLGHGFEDPWWKRLDC